MDIPNSAYLYTLALIAITCVGFTAIVLILRQSVGGTLLPIDSLVARLFMGWGFLLAYLSILPMLLVSFDLEQRLVWRASSAVAGLFFIKMQVIYPIFRSRMTGEATPLHVFLHVFGGITLGGLLLANATAMFPAQMPGIFLTALTLYLVQASFAFVQHFGFMIEQLRKQARGANDGLGRGGRSAGG